VVASALALGAAVYGIYTMRLQNPEGNWLNLYFGFGDALFGSALSLYGPEGTE
jgi:hypothetical protein